MVLVLRIQEVLQTKARIVEIMASTPIVILTLALLFISLPDALANSKTNEGPQPTLHSSGPPINLACRATQLPDLCKSSLSTKVAANAGAEEIIGAAMGLASDGAKQTHLLSQNLLATSKYDANITAAAKNCVEFADSSLALILKSSAALGVEQRIKDVKAWMSAALAYVYDCSSDLRYVNTTHKISTIIQQVDWVTNFTSNALSMVDALDTYGKDMVLWRPPSTERSANPSSTAHYYHLPNKNWDWDVLEVDELVPNITVSKLDHKSSISSIQQAVNSAPDYSEKRFVIKIEAGVYEERVRIPRSKTNLMFVGAGMDTTVITGSAYVPSLPGPVTIYDVATVGVNGDGFIARGITFRNTFLGPRTHQAVALRVDSDFSAFYSCAFESHQDTLYTHTLRQFYKNCRIEGTADFIFGNAAALFHNCSILVRPRQLKSNSGEDDPITAQGRTDPAQSTGLVFQHCTVDGTKEYMKDFSSNPSVHKVYLGRPWKMYSRTVFLNSYLGKLIRPEGWMPWNGTFALDTLFYGEYRNYGFGAKVSGRVPWSNQISELNVGLYSVPSFIQGHEWLPSTDST
jgi:pectinesterase inhibitor-like protein